MEYRPLGSSGLTSNQQQLWMFAVDPAPPPPPAQ
jgi:hypothetical protein